MLLTSLLLIQASSVIRESNDAKAKSAYTTLRIGLMEQVDSLNPYVAFNKASYMFWNLVYDCLFSVDEDLNPVPNLALSAWIVPESDTELVESGEPYGSVWQYNLTHNAFWHDGVAFTADDVVYNIWLNAEVTHYNSMWAFQPYSYFIRTAEKVDSNTVRIHFWDRSTQQPMPVVWGESIPIPMLPKHLLEDYSIAYIGMDWRGVFNESESPGMPIVGTGPFMASSNVYTEWVNGDHITLLKNPSYHLATDQNKEVQFDRLELEIFSDSTAMVLALRNGDLDAARLHSATYKSVKNQVEHGNSSYRNLIACEGLDPGGDFVCLSFLMDPVGPNPARVDLAVRKAISMATNKSRLIDICFSGFAAEGSTLVSPVSEKWHYEPTETEKIKFNLTAANETLQAAGYVDVDSDGIREATINSTAVQMGWVDEGKKLVFEVPLFSIEPWADRSVLNDVKSYISSEWLKIGVSANVILNPDLILPASTMCPIGLDVDLEAWEVMDASDPQQLLFTQSTIAVHGWSSTQYSSSSYDANFNASISAFDPLDRKIYVDNCQKISYNDSPSIVIAYPFSTYVCNNETFMGWGNWSSHPGRNLDACFGANPLIFDLRPAGTPPPPVNYGPVEVLYVGVAAVAVGGVLAGFLLMRVRKNI